MPYWALYTAAAHLLLLLPLIITEEYGGAATAAAGIACGNDRPLKKKSLLQMMKPENKPFPNQIREKMLTQLLLLPLSSRCQLDRTAAAAHDTISPFATPGGGRFMFSEENSVSCE